LPSSAYPAPSSNPICNKRIDSSILTALSSTALLSTIDSYIDTSITLDERSKIIAKKIKLIDT